MGKIYKSPFTGGNHTHLFERCLRAILEHDQDDDWLPDSVYYADYAQDEARNNFIQLVSSGSFSDAGVETVQVPRKGGGSLSVLILPLDLRVGLHCAMSLLGENIKKGLNRDKVFGFEYIEKGPRLFSLPGEGAEDAWEQALVTSAWEGRATLLDITSFNASIDLRQLSSILGKLGGASPLIEFVLGPLEQLSAGAPSIDDAYAFLYNYYLTPVDQALESDGVNFVRYRDEMFVFSESGLQALHRALKSQGFAWTEYALPEVDGLEQSLREEVTFDNPAAEREFKVRDGQIRARYECETWEDEVSCSTDYFEIVYRSLDTDELMRKLWTADSDQLVDGVDLVPLLRGIHKDRRTGRFWSRPSRREATSAFAEYRARLSPLGNRLREALGAAATERSAWQLSWVAPLLGDLGVLADQDVEKFTSVAQDQAFPDIGRQAARLALARDSRTPPTICWTGEESQLHGRALRTAMLTAKFLKEGGAPEPLSSIREAASTREPSLWKFLLEG